MRTEYRTENARRGIVLILLATLIFASQDAITKHLAQTYATPQIVMVRYLLFAVFAMVYAGWNKPLRESFRSGRPVLQVVRSLIIVVEIGMFVLTVRVLPLAETHALLATFPLMVTALSAVLLREAVGIRRWSAVLVGFLGVLVILRPGLGPISLEGAVLGLATAAMFAAYNVLTRMVSRTDDGETSLLYMAVIGAAVMLCVGPFFWVPPTPEAWGLLFVLSCTGAAGHFCLIKALEAAPASALQPFNYTLLVWATALGFLIFGDFPDLFTILGAAVVVGSGLYTIYRERRRAVAKPPVGAVKP